MTGCAAGARGASTVLYDLERALGQTQPESVDYLVGSLPGVAGCAERHEQWREVLGGRVGIRHPRCATPEVDQRVDVAGGETFVGPVVELRTSPARERPGACPAGTAGRGW